MKDRGDVSTERIRTRNLEGELSDPAKVSFLIWKPDGSKETIYWPGGGLNKAAAGVFEYDVRFDQSGTWQFRWETEGTPELAENFSYEVTSDPFGDPVTDLRDTRVLIPRVRRQLEGAGVTDQAIEDEGINGLIADAVANIILFTGGLFGHNLEVVNRDQTYLAPTAWLIDPALTEAEGSLIVIQTQLDFLYNDLKATKVSQTIKDEATEWSYSLSSSAIADLLKGLRAQRDAVLEQIETASVGMTAWVNTLYERDAYTDALIEPYAIPGGYGGQEGFLDPRGF